MGTGGAGGAGGSVAGGSVAGGVPLRAPTDYSDWGKRTCGNLKCKDLDSDPVSDTYAKGIPCDTTVNLCRRSFAYCYCVSNNLQYHKLNDKFYDPEKQK